MSPKDWRIRITDILEAIEWIQRYTEGVTFVEFASNRMMFDAVVRNFGVIGEAAGRVPLEIREQYPEIAWSEMRRMRNFVVHQYDDVNPQIVWDTTTRDLPILASQLQEILASE